MKKNITTLAMSLFLLIGMSNVYAQEKYGAEPEKCKHNLFYLFFMRVLKVKIMWTRTLLGCGVLKTALKRQN